MKKFLQKQTDFLFLLATSFFFFLLRLPSLHEPYWYGDEGIYEVIGYALRHGRDLYSGIWDNKPPLLYLTYALSSGDQFTTRVLSLVFGLAAVITFFFLAKHLFRSQKATYIGTVIFTLLFGTPLFEGNIANAENFMAFPILLAAYLLVTNKPFSPHKNQLLSRKLFFYPPFFFSGLLLGLAFLFKIVAIFDTASFAVFLAISILPALTSLKALKATFTKPHLREVVTTLTPFLTGFILPILLTLLYFFFKGDLSDFLKAAFFNNVGYVDYGNRYIIPQGRLIGKLLLLGITVVLLWMKKEKLSPSILFVFLWFAFSLFNAFFSQRPYSHYVLVLVPAFSLLVGSIFVLKKRLQMMTAIVAILVAVLIPISFWHASPKKITAYYNNFLSFVTSQKDVRSYQAFFDRRVPGDYDVVTYLKLHLKPEDQIFVWGNTAQLYKMVDRIPPGKFTVAYHMTTNDQTLKESVAAVEEVKPKYIVVLPDVRYIPFYLKMYTPKVTIDRMTIYERLP